MSKNFVSAHEWRRRKKQRAKDTATPLQLPTGVTIGVSRPPIETWFGTAKLPSHLSQIVINVFDVQLNDPDLVDKVEQRMNSMSQKDSEALVGFFNRLLLEGVVEPQLVDKDPESLDPNEMALSELDEEERAYIILAFMQGLPDQPAQVASGGEVSPHALGKFRSWSGGVSSGETGGEVQPAAQPAGGAQIPG